MKAVLTALVASAAVLAGCGSSDGPKGKGIPPESVAALQDRLDEIQRRFDDATDNTPNVGACNDIQSDSFKAVATTVSQLPDDVDPDIRDTLEAGLQRLQKLTEEGCAGVERPTTEATPPATVPPETTPQHTETEQTTTETTPSKEPPGQQKKDKNKDGGTTPPDGNGGGLPAPLPGEGG